MSSGRTAPRPALDRRMPLAGARLDVRQAGVERVRREPCPRTVRRRSGPCCIRRVERHAIERAGCGCSSMTFGHVVVVLVVRAVADAVAIACPGRRLHVGARVGESGRLLVVAGRPSSPACHAATCLRPVRQAVGVLVALGVVEPALPRRSRRVRSSRRSRSSASTSLGSSVVVLVEVDAMSRRLRVSSSTSPGSRVRRGQVTSPRSTIETRLRSRSQRTVAVDEPSTRKSYCSAARPPAAWACGGRRRHTVAAASTACRPSSSGRSRAPRARRRFQSANSSSSVRASPSWSVLRVRAVERVRVRLLARVRLYECGSLVAGRR